MSVELKKQQLEFKVLDHGHLNHVEHMGSDQRVVEAARNSTGKGFISWDAYNRCETCGLTEFLKEGRAEVGDSPLNCPSHKMAKFENGDMGILDRLWRKKHSTPFEFCVLTIEVMAPIMVFREWHRSRTQGYSEFSARYAQMPNVHYLPLLERVQKQSATNKQGSGEAMPEAFAMKVISKMGEEQERVYDSYDEWVEEGLAKEVARINTPISRYSKMWAIANVRNWLWFLNLRMRPSAQWEIRQYANAVASIIEQLYPRIYFLFEEYDLYGTHLSRSEMRAIRDLMDELKKLDSSEAGVKGTLTAFARLRGLNKTKLAELHEKLEFGGDKIFE